MTYTVSVVGSNRFNEYHIFEDFMSSIISDMGKPSKVISIGERGACYVAQRWAMIREIKFDMLGPMQSDDFFDTDVVVSLPHTGDTWTEGFIKEAEKNNISCHIQRV